MNIDSFESLLAAAALQTSPQQLLLAFTAAEAEPGPTQATPRQTLIPVMCVAKSVGELDTFANLAQEAGAMGKHWDVVLVSTLSGRPGQLPDSQRTDAALQQMIGSIQAGQMENFLAFDRSGDLLRFS